MLLYVQCDIIVTRKAGFDAPFVIKFWSPVIHVHLQRMIVCPDPDNLARPHPRLSSVGISAPYDYMYLQDVTASQPASLAPSIAIRPSGSSQPRAHEVGRLAWTLR